MVFEGLGALGSDGGVQGRVVAENGLAKRQIPHPFGSKFSMCFGNSFDAVFEEAPGSEKHRKLLQKLWILEGMLVTFWQEADIKK